jgi:glutaconate CoA-transferase subunit B
MIADGPWKQRTQASTFNEREFQVCTTARLVEDARTYWVAAGGSPMYSVLLAKKLYAPNALYVTEDGIIAAEPLLPLDPVMTVIGARPSYRAVMWTTMNGVADHCAVGHMDCGILNTLQIDPFGNINSTWVGDYPVEGRRMNGPGGADTIAAQCRRVIIITDHQQRKFVPRVDFISSPGYLDGSPGARERVGLPRGTGPWAVVTNWAVFDFEEGSRRMRLRACSPRCPSSRFSPRTSRHSTRRPRRSSRSSAARWTWGGSSATPPGAGSPGRRAAGPWSSRAGRRFERSWVGSGRPAHKWAR